MPQRVYPESRTNPRDKFRWKNPEDCSGGKKSVQPYRSMPPRDYPGCRTNRGINSAGNIPNIALLGNNRRTPTYRSMSPRDCPESRKKKNAGKIPKIALLEKKNGAFLASVACLLTLVSGVL